MTNPYVFIQPFGNSGNRAAVPTDDPGDGSMSYQLGYTPDYQLDLNTNPNALPILRTQMNQVLYDATNAIFQYQSHGVPYWITSSDNGGSPFAYDIYARVIYNPGSGNLLYENQVQGNTTAPGVDNTWIVISGSVGIPSGTVLDYAGNTPPVGFLNCNGTTVSRTTYSTLMGAITTRLTGTMNGTITVTGISSTANLYVGMPVEGTNIASSTTVASIVSGTSITLSNAATGSGTNTLTFFQWGNGDGSTTFTLPNFNRSVAMGSGGTGTSIIGSVVGNAGGEESHTLSIGEMPAHTHPGTANISGDVAGGSPNGITFGANDQSSNKNVQLTVASQGGGGAHNTIQPSVIVNKIIKT